MENNQDQIELKKRIETIDKEVKENKVILYMKGDKDMPQCGFSSQVVQVLNLMGIKFETRNVLEDDYLREGIKQYSDWPTIPQLYVNGEFIGGCDIIMEMYENGDLKTAIEA
ncbi:Grx4 family monothiol glutaredoxin [bacterium]|nr:Grx4 family monothiol glutaredoxin [bacterium]